MRVAIVDDSSVVQQRLSQIMCGIAGVEVVGFASSVDGAKRLIEETSPDVVILDVELGGGETSMGVLRHIVRNHPRTEAIMLSNFTWASMRDSFLMEGAKAYFDKSLEFMQARDWIAERSAAMD